MSKYTKSRIDRMDDRYKLPSSDSEDEAWLNEAPLELVYDEQAAAKLMESMSTPVQTRRPSRKKSKKRVVSQKKRRKGVASEKYLKRERKRQKIDADAALAPMLQDLGKTQMKELRELLLQHNINSSAFGWGYTGKFSSGKPGGWQSDKFAPETMLHLADKNIYFMCGVTDRLMRFYADHQTFVPRRFAYSHEGNDWRLTSGLVDETRVKDYCFEPTIHKFLQANKKNIDALHIKLRRFLRQDYVDPFVRRLGFLFACGVATLRVCANAKKGDRGSKIAAKIKSALTRLLNLCHYDTDLQQGVGILVNQLPDFPELDWQDNKDLQMVHESSAGKKVDTDLHVHLFTKLRF